jgi:Cof subfamily protein (haloacid dehalogenase superfamily)
VKYRLVALDIDGTLLDHQSRVGPRTRAAMAQAAARGVRFVLCTGRRYSTTLPIMKDLQLEVNVVVNSGAMVKNSLDHRTLFRNGMTLKLALGVVELLLADGLMPTLFTDEFPGGPDFYVLNEREGNPFYLRYLANNKHVYRVSKDFTNAPADCIIEVTVFDAGGKLDAPMQRLRQRFGDAITTQIVRFSKHGNVCDCLEVLNRDASKWNALLHVAKDWGIQPAEIVAVGDQLNDLDMIKGAGLGVAMDNAVPELKAEADIVTASCDQDGVGVLLERLMGATDQIMPEGSSKRSEAFPP